MTIEIWKHGRTGLLYAVEIDDLGNIARASESLDCPAELKLAYNGEFVETNDPGWIQFYAGEFIPYWVEARQP